MDKNIMFIPQNFSMWAGVNPMLFHGSCPPPMNLALWETSVIPTTPGPVYNVSGTGASGTVYIPRLRHGALMPGGSMMPLDVDDLAVRLMMNQGCAPSQRTHVSVTYRPSSSSSSSGSSGSSSSGSSYSSSSSPAPVKVGSRCVHSYMKNIDGRAARVYVHEDGSTRIEY